MPGRPMPHGAQGSFWLYGWHAVLAALRNPRRRVLKALATTGAAGELERELGHLSIPVGIVETAAIGTLLPPGAVHQGIACEVRPLGEVALGEIKARTVVVLDQVTDPHNVGAILRSAAAFEAGAVVVPRDHCPAESGAMAKAASGALEIVPLVPVSNLAAALKDLKGMGYWCLGLDGGAETELAAVPDYDKIALILGAEGKGLRRLTRDGCDVLAALPMAKAMESLNVSNAAAVALYELHRRKRKNA